MISGIIFTIVIGTLLHFIYELSLENPIAGVFGSVNESTWEHLKLLFWPMFFYTLIGYFIFGKKYENYFTAVLKGIIVGLLTIIIIFYTYTGIIGTNLLLLDILTFIVGVVFAFIKMYNNIISLDTDQRNSFVMNSKISFLIIILIAILFIVFTFFPPKLGLFITA